MLLFARDTIPTPATGDEYLNGGIPKLLHQVRMRNDSHDPTSSAPASWTDTPTVRFDWSETCTSQNPGWRHIIWDEQMATSLLETLYPAFLPTFKNLDSGVKKSLAIRPFILHAYGGLYLDLDTECFRDVSDSLQNYTLVLQRDNSSITPAQMASIPGHPLWELAWKHMQQQVPEQQQSVNATDIFSDLVDFTEVVTVYLGNITGIIGPGEDTHMRDTLNKWKESQDRRYTLLSEHADVSKPMYMMYKEGKWFTAATRYEWSSLISDAAGCRTVLNSMNSCPAHMERSKHVPSYSACSPDHEPSLDGHMMIDMDAYCPHIQAASAALHTDRKQDYWRALPLKTGLTGECMRRFSQLYGVHHHTDFWIDRSHLTGKPALEYRKAFHAVTEKAVGGAVVHYRRADNFVQILPNGCSARPAPTDSRRTWIRKALWPLEEAEVPAVYGRLGHECRVLSVILLGQNAASSREVCCGDGPSSQGSVADIATLHSWAAMHGCSMSVITDDVSSLWTHVQQHDIDSDGISVMQLDMMGQQALTSASWTHALLTWRSQQPVSSRLIAMHVSLPGLGIWQVMNETRDSDFSLLGPLHPLVVLLETPLLPVAHHGSALLLYQHLQQGLKYIGHAHKQLRQWYYEWMRQYKQYQTLEQTEPQAQPTASFRHGDEALQDQAHQVSCRNCVQEQGSELDLEPLLLGFVNPLLLYSSQRQHNNDNNIMHVPVTPGGASLRTHRPVSQVKRVHGSKSTLNDVPPLYFALYTIINNNDRSAVRYAMLQQQAVAQYMPGVEHIVLVTTNVDPQLVSEMRSAGVRMETSDPIPEDRDKQGLTMLRLWTFLQYDLVCHLAPDVIFFTNITQHLVEDCASKVLGSNPPSLDICGYEEETCKGSRIDENNRKHWGMRYLQSSIVCLRPDFDIYNRVMELGGKSMAAGNQTKINDKDVRTCQDLLNMSFKDRIHYYNCDGGRAGGRILAYANVEKEWVKRFGALPRGLPRKKQLT